VAILWSFFPTIAFAADSAVVLMYHRFGDSGHPKNNIQLDQFDAHLAELSKEKYHVLPLPDILSAIKTGKTLPKFTVAITIDDAFQSVFTRAVPRLKSRGFPFTLFVSTRAIESGSSSYMNWDQIRALRDAGAEIGHKTHSYLHMANKENKTLVRDIEAANKRFKTELGFVPKLFAYPYGETNIKAMTIVKELGFAFAFGQHSGVVHRTSEPYFLPRFPLTEQYGSESRFRLIANASPLPISEITPRNPSPNRNPPLFGFTVDQTIVNMSRLSCFHSKQGKVPTERLGSHRIEIRFRAALNQGRSRLNCTMPGPNGRWRWFGWQYFIPKKR
jgi:peptidoglycan/xylan/chitin deacetylase (PgdA/CDA1 family)